MKKYYTKSSPHDIGTIDSNKLVGWHNANSNLSDLTYILFYIMPSTFVLVIL